MTTLAEPSAQPSTNGHTATNGHTPPNDHTVVERNGSSNQEGSQRAPKPALSSATLRQLLGGLPLSALTGVALWLGLVWAAGPWNILANTRILDFLFDAGVIALTDANAGFWRGLPSPDYYVKSQDPVDWNVIALVGLLFVGFWWLKALQFHDLANHNQLGTSFRQNVRAYFRGLAYKRTMPWGYGDAAATAELTAQGAEPKRVHSLLFLANTFVIFEIVVFAAFALLGLGWGAWINQMFWALVILGGCWLWSRPVKSVRQQQPSVWKAVGATAQSLFQNPGRLLRVSALSLMAFGIEDIAAYLVAMGFTSSNVILNVDFSVLLMGVVGSYIARLVRFTPGGLGQFEWGFATALYIGGVGLPEAATIAILDNLFRYASLGIVTLVLQFGPRVTSTFNDVCHVLANGLNSLSEEPSANGAVASNRNGNGLHRNAAINGSASNGVSDNGATNNGAGNNGAGSNGDASNSAGSNSSHDDGDEALPAHSLGQVSLPASTGLGAVPAVPAPYVPPASVVWNRVLIIFWLGLLYFLDRFTVLLADFWMLESLQLSSVFWTNLGMGATLFVAAFVGFFLAATVPAMTHRLTRTQIGIFAQVAVQVGLFAGMQLSSRYLSFLMTQGGSFGQLDPVFGRDIGYYVFTLPAVQTTTTTVLLGSIVLFISSIIAASIARRNQNKGRSDLLGWVGTVSTSTTQISVLLMGVASAAVVWFSRFDLLYKDNSDSALPTGAGFLDVTGLFSTLNQIQLTSIVVLVSGILLLLLLRQWNQALPENGVMVWSQPMRRTAMLLGILIGADLLFASGVYVRDLVAVTPNEPIVQLPYIQHHLDATRAGFGLDDIEQVEFVPKGADAPLPSAAELLDSPVMKNAPLWPGYASYLEPLLDPQHSQRVLQTGGDHMVYGPTLEILRQQQKLRTYYNFMSVDPLRFTEDGETTVYVSSVRELPLLDPQPWLTWWGQRFLMFTHGFGMVMAPISEITAAGTPDYATKSIPVQTENPAFDVANPRVYFGEGSVTMAISNIQDLKEFDYPTAQGRAENILVEQEDIGVPVDSLLKRLVFGWRSGQFFEMVFSGLLTEETHLQYYRTPLIRLERIAPFLAFDSNIYAVPTEDEIVWLANGMATTDHYPYSQREYLGDKSVSRGPEHVEMKKINYVEDAVKATMSAADGTVKLYQISDDPIISTWAEIYPELFIDATADNQIIPEAVRQQLTYPLQLFHIQFDDIYNIYHMDEAVYFFNMEDMWDDADEVLGPIMDEGKAINFSIEPYHQLLQTNGVLPESDRGTQFSLMSVFTPENALNLRGVPIAYQDGDDYGRLVVLQVPKGTFVMGPEQADAAIDQDPLIAQQISLWNRQGTEVIRGHTSLLVVDDELIYVEPLFIRSKQNPVTQLKQVVVVFRGQPYMADTLDAAIRLAVGEDGNGTLASTIQQ